MKNTVSRGERVLGQLVRKTFPCKGGTVFGKSKICIAVVRGLQQNPPIHSCSTCYSQTLLHTRRWSPVVTKDQPKGKCCHVRVWSTKLQEAWGGQVLLQSDRLFQDTGRATKSYSESPEPSSFLVSSLLPPLIMQEVSGPHKTNVQGGICSPFSWSLQSLSNPHINTALTKQNLPSCKQLEDSTIEQMY